jgi:hypothetical protein
MLQNNIFSGKPRFSQIIGLINKTLFSELIKEYDADRYCKQCKSWEHFICMLYCIINNCTSLREVTQVITCYCDKLNHLGITYTPSRSTFSDANAIRDKTFFGDVYDKLYKHYKSILSDSQTQNELLKRVFIIDSTTLSLFKAIMKCVGRKAHDVVVVKKASKNIQC